MKMVKAGIAYCALTSVALGMDRENIHEDKQDILTQAVALNRVPPSTVRRLVSISREQLMVQDIRRKRVRIQDALKQAQARKVDISARNFEEKRKIHKVTAVKALSEIFDENGQRLHDIIYLMPKKLEGTATVKLEFLVGDRYNYYANCGMTIQLENIGGKMVLRYIHYGASRSQEHEVKVKARPDEGTFFSLSNCSTELQQLFHPNGMLEDVEGCQFRIGYA